MLDMVAGQKCYVGTSHACDFWLDVVSAVSVAVRALGLAPPEA